MSCDGPQAAFARSTAEHSRLSVLVAHIDPAASALARRGLSEQTVAVANADADDLVLQLFDNAVAAVPELPPYTPEAFAELVARVGGAGAIRAIAADLMSADDDVHRNATTFRIMFHKDIARHEDEAAACYLEAVRRGNLRAAAELGVLGRVKHPARRPPRAWIAAYCEVLQSCGDTPTSVQILQEHHAVFSDELLRAVLARADISDYIRGMVAGVLKARGDKTSAEKTSRWRDGYGVTHINNFSHPRFNPSWYGTSHVPTFATNDNSPEEEVYRLATATDHTRDYISPRALWLARTIPHLRSELVYGILARLRGGDDEFTYYFPDDAESRAELAQEFSRAEDPVGVAVSLGHLLPVADLTAALARTTDDYEAGALTAALELARLPLKPSDALLGSHAIARCLV